MDRFEKLKVLGRGAFAVAYLVRDKTTGEQLVVKRFNVPMDALTASEKAEALNEVGLLASLRHDHIIGYREHFEDANILHIVMECVSLVWVTPGVQQPTHLTLCVCACRFARGGSLDQVLEALQGPPSDAVVRSRDSPGALRLSSNPA